MRIGPRSKTVILWAGAGLGLCWLSGCAQSGSNFVLPRRTSMGTLKASLSHLEFENQQLRREVAQLKTISRDVEDRLVQEETQNGELRATLDDARHLLSQRGFDFDGRPASTLGAPAEEDDRNRMIPAGQSNRKRRRAPFTQIPGRLEPIPRAEPDDSDDQREFDPASATRNDSGLGPQSRRDEPERWLPIAQGTTKSTAKAKVR